MQRIDAFYDLLSRDASPVCDQILAAGLELADADYADRIIDMLVRRDSDSSWAGLLANHDRLPLAIRESLGAHPERIKTCLSIAARWQSPEARKNVYEVLAERPFPHLAYLLPDGLRDGSSAVRDAAVRALRRMAEEYLDRSNPAVDGEHYRQDLPAVRRLFAEAIWVCFRSFDRHLRLEVFEVGLWFARLFDRELWDVLDEPRSRGGFVVREHLRYWDNPRLAPFLLLALRHNAWRRHALRALREWSSTECLRALLQHSDLLADAEIRRQVGVIRHPAWMAQVDVKTGGWSEAELALLPRWVCALGYTDTERISMLQRWRMAPSARLRRAATYALATITSTDALLAIQEQIHADDADLKPFIRWVRNGRGANVLREREGTTGNELMAGDAPSLAAHHSEFGCLALLLEDPRAVGDDPAFEAVCVAIDEWAPKIRRGLAGRDPRDRILALRVAKKHTLQDQFADEIAKLRDDVHPGVRREAWSAGELR